VTTSGTEALEALDGTRFDAILCDLMMPGMSGMDFYEELGKQHPAMRRRVVFMTGGAFLPKIADFTARIPNRVMEKPFEVDVVMKAIEATVSEEAAHRPNASDSLSDPSTRE
jgi:DNA-binding NtrC family response regulator